ncbi:hypothetical protein X896_788 [Burkholderia pseudomallei ABCPW 1]|nr:hypothetical protein X896_788 [Burkholderia pseudomallei ABCPW 1]
MVAGAVAGLAIVSLLAWGALDKWEIKRVQTFNLNRNG